MTHAIKDGAGVVVTEFTDLTSHRFGVFLGQTSATNHDNNHQTFYNHTVTVLNAIFLRKELETFY